MNFFHIPLLAFSSGLLLAVPVYRASADIQVATGCNRNDEADGRFEFKTLERPYFRKMPMEFKLEIIDGTVDPNSAGVAALSDGVLPADADQPNANFFFAPASNGGRILIDLGQSTELDHISSYSWHPGGRGPQKYILYAGKAETDGLVVRPKRPQDPSNCGWIELAKVWTGTTNSQEQGGQYGVCIKDSSGKLGPFRYLLFDIQKTDGSDPFGNTFYSEIEVVTPGLQRSNPAPVRIVETVHAQGYTINLDTSETPDLTNWVHQRVAPMAQEWYPRLASMLPSRDFKAPDQVTILFDSKMRGVAATSGTRIRCAARWFRQNLDGEALGAVFHELVHVVQQYNHATPLAEGARRPPGWLVEGIADYIRWYQFEPDSHGADISPSRVAQARYDASYRPTANFLNWTTQNYRKDLVPRINAAIREGRYNDQLWKEITGSELQELGDRWKNALAPASPTPASAQ